MFHPFTACMSISIFSPTLFLLMPFPQKAESTPSNDISIKMRHLNKMRNTTRRYQERLVLLRQESQRLKPERDLFPPSPTAHSREDDEIAAVFMPQYHVEMCKT